MFLLDFMNAQDREGWALRDRRKPHWNPERLCIFKQFLLSLPALFPSTSFQDWLSNQRFPNTSQNACESMKNLNVLILRPQPPFESPNHLHSDLFRKDPDLPCPEEELNWELWRVLLYKGEKKENKQKTAVPTSSPCSPPHLLTTVSNLGFFGIPSFRALINMLSWLLLQLETFSVTCLLWKMRM